MAATSGRKAPSSQKGGRGAKSSHGAKNSAGKSPARERAREIDAYQAGKDREMFREIGLIVLFMAAVFLFCCNVGMMGDAGEAVRAVLFGLFGFSAYLAPILLFVAVAFWFANEGSPTAARKLAAGIVLFFMFGIFCDLAAKGAVSLEKYDVKAIYHMCSSDRKGGGILAGSLAYLLCFYLEGFGTVLVAILCCVVSGILLTEKSLIGGIQSRGSLFGRRGARDEEPDGEDAWSDRQERDEQRLLRKKEQEEQRLLRRKEQEEQRLKKEEERKLRLEEKENEKILRVEKKVTGVMLDTALKGKEERRTGDIHEIIYADGEGSAGDAMAQMPTRAQMPEIPVRPSFDFEKIQIRSSHQVMMEDFPEMDSDMPAPDAAIHLPANQLPMSHAAAMSQFADYAGDGAGAHAADERDFLSDDAVDDAGLSAADGVVSFEDYRGRMAQESHESSFRQGGTHRETTGFGAAGSGSRAGDAPRFGAAEGGNRAAAPVRHEEKKTPPQYLFPPLSRLKKGKAATGDSSRELKDTAMRLQQTLHNFGVNVTITDISQGPSVTRYELQPEQGVKVSKIVSLSDDIKLNLAATDIRIEAPIPGKAAVGIEVPNKENMMVALRDLLESREFQDFPSNLAFAVGKDIAGKIVVADIAKMPHMLIAGATGSGKSVCINTLIMSILYKAHPDNVKLIMVDPKVVELSVYNGIPHLLIPVVTDPKKASAALHWGVTEMEDRYRKFADYNVRDLKGYNEKVENLRQSGDESAPAKLAQIVIIVDELADLMMVCPGEVEESICRLAQLARAAGIHLIIATQRPSVDVITGLIKANMPSRVAFSVSSGVDSRTILDMNGAEKLLGKGDMLFYPQGYTKPARVQGAFVSDGEVSDVVDFLKNQTLGNTYAEDVEEQLQNLSYSSGASAGGGDGEARDEYFAEAGRFIIDKDKASIGMLQRVFKIGFNRAARIMDQLCDYGVVGEEEGTKPRKILMSMEQFEQLLEEV